MVHKTLDEWKRILEYPNKISKNDIIFVVADWEFDRINLEKEKRCSAKDEVIDWKEKYK